MARTILAEHRPTFIREAEEGTIVKVVGRVRVAEQSVRSPLTSKTGVYFDVLVTAGGVQNQHPLRIHEREAVDFYIEDETGRALVRTRDMQVVIVRDVDETVSLFSRRDGLRELLEAHGAEGRRSMNVREGTLELDEYVAVVGQATWVPGDAGSVPVSYRERPETLVLRAPDEHPLIVSDDPDTFE